jgi:hypothetical protein
MTEDIARRDTQHVRALGVWEDRPNRGAFVIAFGLTAFSGGIVGAALVALFN